MQAATDGSSCSDRATITNNVFPGSACMSLVSGLEEALVSRVRGRACGMRMIDRWIFGVLLGRGSVVRLHLQPLEVESMLNDGMLSGCGRRWGVRPTFVEAR